MARTVIPHQGVVIPSLDYMMAYRMMAANVYAKVKEIIHNLVASGLVFQPTGARDFQAPELRPYLDKYLRSSKGDAIERVKLMKMLWDAVGTEFAGRHELYERNNAGNHEAIRMHPFFESRQNGLLDELKGFVDDSMADYDLGGWTAPDLINPTDIDFFQSAPNPTNRNGTQISQISKIQNPRSSAKSAYRFSSSEAQSTAKQHQLTDAERHKILVEWNDTDTDYPKDKCIHHLFEEWAERTPDAVAVKVETEVKAEEEVSSLALTSITYRQLNERANQLAHYLQTIGVGPETLVGISVERSVEMIVGVLGILKAGGAYLPMDPAYPRERLAFMLTDAQVPILLTQEKFADNLPINSDQIVLYLDRDWSKISRFGNQNPVCNVTPDNIAYVIYTSGSTGKPKGVVVEHRGLSNLAIAQINAFGVTSESHVLQFSSLSFDASIFEITMAFGPGACLHLASQESLVPSPELITLLQKRAITHITIPPSALSALPHAALPSLQTLIVAGEACPPNLVSTWVRIDVL